MGLFVLSILATTILVFTGFFLLFRKYSSQKKPLSNLYYWITAIIATPFFYIGFLFIWFLISSSYERKEFDQENWAKNRNLRYVYVEDLIDGKKLLGLTSSELKIMLGDPDRENDSTMIFYIGYSPKQFLNSIPDWLETDLYDGKVSNVYVRK